MRSFYDGWQGVVFFEEVSLFFVVFFNYVRFNLCDFVLKILM